MNFKKAKVKVLENFLNLEVKLEQAIDQGFRDEQDVYYNSITMLGDDVNLTTTWPQLEEVIYKGKSLEQELDAWLALKGYTTYGLEWPSEESSES